MNLVEIDIDDLVTSSEMTRARTSKVFEERLRASIEEMGLAEPLKVALLPTKKYLVVDGMLRLQAIRAVRLNRPGTFERVPAYVVDHKKRFEIRFQTDIYQDLLPSQLAQLVEHLHAAEGVRKTYIARYIGVSPATLRNYTGLWRLIERGGLFAGVVELMDASVLPASTPYAWLRLSDLGIRTVLESFFSDGQPAEGWIKDRLGRARRGDIAPYALGEIEEVTGSLDPDCYREDTEVRNRKRELGLRRGAASAPKRPALDRGPALRHVGAVARGSPDLVLRRASAALEAYLA